VSEPIAIRQATPADADTLIELRERMFSVLGVDDPEAIGRLRELAAPWTRDAIESGRATGFIAERDGVVVGGVSLCINRTQPQRRVLDGRVATVFGLFVAEEERGAGLGRALVERCIEFARSEGIALVSLHAAPAAKPLYERLGFTESSEMVLFLGE